MSYISFINIRHYKTIITIIRPRKCCCSPGFGLDKLPWTRLHRQLLCNSLKYLLNLQRTVTQTQGTKWMDNSGMIEGFYGITLLIPGSILQHILIDFWLWSHTFVWLSNERPREVDFWWFLASLSYLSTFIPFWGQNGSSAHAAELFCFLLRHSSLQSRWLHALTCTYKQVDSANWNDHGYRIA